MKPFIEQAKVYGSFHQKPATRYTHFVGVPLLIFSLMIFFSFIHVVIPGVASITLAEGLTIGVLVYYILLNWRLGLSILPVYVILLWLGDLIGRQGPTEFALTFFLCSFILGWIIQLVGHFIEGNRPAFTKKISRYPDFFN